MHGEILSLPLEKKIGQLFFIGILEPEINADNRKLLKTISPGGVCLFARNIREAEQTGKLLEDIRENLEIEPLLSLDQEGGLVDRLRRILPPMPAPSALKEIEDVKTLAVLTSELIKILGFNMNFAPVVDVIDKSRDNSQNGLYSRTFGNSKNEAAEYARIYLESLEKNNCLGCLKHFPGLGASKVDSHEELPIVNLTREELFATDLFPYRQILPVHQTASVMIAHAAYPKFDLQERDRNGKLLPSSLSFNIVTKLLREELEFQGLAITDDLEMGAIVKNYGIGEACKMAVSAGIDMPAICANPDAISEGFYAVLKAVENKEISETRIDESLQRIAQIKSLLQPPPPFDAQRLRTLGDAISLLNTKVNAN